RYNHPRIGNSYPPIQRVARRHRVCPFELSLELALWSDLVICDYNHGLDPRSGLKRLGVEDRGGCTFLVDEAHNLVDRSRRMFSARLRKRRFFSLRRALVRDRTSPAGDGSELLARSAGRINDWLAKTRRRLERGDLPAADREAPHDLYPLLREFAEEAERQLALAARIEPPGPGGSLPNFKELLDLYFEVAWFLKTAEQYDENYATCRETKNGNFSLMLFCLDPAPRVEEALTRCRSAVFFSATLTPMQYFERVFGLTQTAQRLVLPSPFPAGNHCLLIYDGISTRYRDRTDTASAVARALTIFVSARPGNYLFFFPSYLYLAMVHQHFCRPSPPAEIIMQTPAMAEEEREAFLEKFSEQQKGTCVGFSVMGGVFGEGIDLVGERLTGAVVVGVGLPGICPERELIADHFQQQEGKGFDYSYRYPGIQRVLQAAGRVIRSENDRGAVLLIGDRFSRFSYRRLLPREWNPVRVGSERAVSMALDRFWGSTGF
ncbi:MAG: ATP-dependent DNA helicase, partial [Acidobacteriota bacterium]